MWPLHPSWGAPCSDDCRPQEPKVVPLAVPMCMQVTASGSNAHAARSFNRRLWSGVRTGRFMTAMILLATKTARGTFQDLATRLRRA